MAHERRHGSIAGGCGAFRCHRAWLGGVRYLVDVVSLTDDLLIDQIEQIRAANNTHWMDLVRLAFKHAPDEARAIMKAIAAADGDIRRLTQELSR